MKLYRVVEVSRGAYTVEQGERRGLLRRFHWDSLFADTDPTPEAAIAHLENYVAYWRKYEEEHAGFPREIYWGHVAHNGKFYQLREDGR